MLRIILAIIMGCVLSLSFAKENAQPLPLHEAFQFSADVYPNNQLLLTWQIAPGYYLYKDQVRITTPALNQIKIDPIQLPKGLQQSDGFRGTYQTYSGTLTIPIILHHPNGLLKLKIQYQGCSVQGFCYPPVKKEIQVNLIRSSQIQHIVVNPYSRSLKPTDPSYAEKLFKNNSYFVILVSFLGLGLLLAFTPCVLPMIPILSGIIVGRKHITTAHAFLLSLAYVFGMALTYAIAGIAVASIGSSIQTWFQQAWVIALLSGMFVLLALSLFGFYELELPAHWQQRITALSNRQKSGTYIGVFLMGALSSLIVSPCVSAPLVGVLAYIAQTGNKILGGIALFALGLGMGVPLLLVGISAGKILPKTGPWMESVKKFFGILLLAVAIWMLSRVIAGPVALFLWATLMICAAIFLGVFTPANNNGARIRKSFGTILFIYGIILMIGTALGNSNPLQPFENLKMAEKNRAPFLTIKNMAELNDALVQAKKSGKPVILDFYADWCTECLLIDRHVLSQSTIKQQLMKYTLLRADITHNNDFDQEILKRFQVIAPPTILFFTDDGQELTNKRIVGGINVTDFSSLLQQL